MKTTLLSLAFGFISGALLSYNLTAQHFEAKAKKEQAAYANALPDELAKQMETGQWQR